LVQGFEKGVSKGKTNFPKDIHVTPRSGEKQKWVKQLTKGPHGGTTHPNKREEKAGDY